MKKIALLITPLEEKFHKISLVITQFFRSQSTAFIILVINVVLAIVLFNSQWRYLYEGLLYLPIRVQVGHFVYADTLVNWVNDILMVLFFFLIGLELKREVLVGELRNPKMRNFAILTSLGGIIFPALIYYVLNYHGDFAYGWGIPMSTDTPFSIGLLALLGNRVPRQLLILLIAISIFDDMATVMVLIATGADKLTLASLGHLMLPIGLLIFINILGVRSSLPYFLLGIVLWILLKAAGLHATSLAGLLVAFSVPARPQYEQRLFTKIANGLIRKLKQCRGNEKLVLEDEEQHHLIENLHHVSLRSTTPLQHWKGMINTPVGILIIPLFGLLNAGVTIDAVSMYELISHPISLSIAFGLIGGKFLGIVSMAWLALKLKLGALPSDVEFKHIIGLGLVCGIGFSMAIFIAGIAFGEGSHELMVAKLSIITTSMLSIILTTAWFCVVCAKDKEQTAL